ncbi:MAG: ankyrin repeat protein [uncultured bacterium]|nr:MAG: ankyrin repeat protein [uncultured bacterium]
MTKPLSSSHADIVAFCRQAFPSPLASHTKPASTNTSSPKPVSCKEQSSLQATSSTSTPQKPLVFSPVKTSLDALPDELKLEILGYLPFKTVAHMGALSKTWCRVTRDNLLWRRKIETDLPWLTVPKNTKTDFLATFKTYYEKRNTDLPDFQEHCDKAMIPEIKKAFPFMTNIPEEFIKEFDELYQKILPEIKRIFSIMRHGQECIEAFDELCRYFEKYPNLLTNYHYETIHYKNALMVLTERGNLVLNKEFFLKIKERLTAENPILLNLNLIGWMIALHAYKNWDTEIKPYLINNFTEQKKALSAALHYSNHKAVEKLLEFETLHCAMEIDNCKNTPLFMAAKFSDLEMITLLLLRGASATVNTPNLYNKRPLHVVACRGNIAMIQKLLGAGAEANALCKWGWTPFLYLIRYAADPEEGMTLLINAGAKLELDTLAKDIDGWNALMTAAGKNNPQAVQFLLDEGARIDLRDNEGKTALDITLDYYQKSIAKHNYHNQTQRLVIIRLLLSHPFTTFPALHEALKRGSLNQENLHEIHEYLNQNPDFKIPQAFFDDITDYLEKNTDLELKKIFYFVFFLSSYVNNYANKKDYKKWFSLLSPLMKFVDGLDKEIKTLTQTYTHRDTLSPENYTVALHFFRKFENFPWVEALLDADAEFNILPQNEEITLDLTLTNKDNMLTRILISRLFKMYITQTTLASREDHNFSLCNAAKKECLSKAEVGSINLFLDENPKFKISHEFIQNLKDYLEKKKLSTDAKEIFHFSLILCYYVNRYQNKREHHQFLFLSLDGLPQFFSRSEKLKAMEAWLTTAASSGRKALQTQYPALTHDKLKNTLSL